MTPVPRSDSFSWAYRVGFRIRLILLHVMGPATLDPEHDPRARLKRDHARRRALDEQRRREAFIRRSWGD